MPHCLVVSTLPLWKVMEFVNGKDDIPYMKWKIKNVWNHQPDHQRKPYPIILKKKLHFRYSKPCPRKRFWPTPLRVSAVFFCCPILKIIWFFLISESVFSQSSCLMLKTSSNHGFLSIFPNKPIHWKVDPPVFPCLHGGFCRRLLKLSGNLKVDRLPCLAKMGGANQSHQMIYGWIG